MSIHTSQARLMDALKVLNQRWARVRERWDDAAARDIHKESVEPLEAIVRSAVHSLNHVADLAQRVRRDCEDDA